MQLHEASVLKTKTEIYDRLLINPKILVSVTAYDFYCYINITVEILF